MTMYTAGNLKSKIQTFSFAFFALKFCFEKQIALIRRSHMSLLYMSPCSHAVVMHLLNSAYLEADTDWHNL